jgi:hypothetical protein
MKLVYESTGVEVKTGDVVHVKGTPYFVMETREPHKPSSTGRVFCKAMNDQGWVNEWFPSVIGADWIDRKDR